MNQLVIRPFFLFPSWRGLLGALAVSAAVVCPLGGPLSGAHAAEGNSRSIEIQGLNKTQITRLRHDFPSLEKGNVKLADLDDVLRALYETGQFENVEISKHDASHFLLRAYPILHVQDVRVQGTTLFGAQEVVDTLGLVKGESLNRARVLEGVETLKTRYNEAGFLATQITIQFKNETNGYTVLVLVDEGPSSTIAGFEFVTTDSEIQEDLQRLAKPFLKKRFQQAELNQFQSLVNDMFVDRRYLTTTISLPELHYSTDKSTVRVVYRIENPVRFVLQFEGNVILSNADLYGALQLTAHMGSAVNIASDLGQKINLAYRKRGYANVNVQVEDQIQDTVYVRKLNFIITEGPKIKIKDIQFTGTYSRPAKFYHDLLRQNAASIVRAGFYSKEDFDLAAQNLQLELQKQGYLRAKVQNTRADFNPKFPEVKVLVQLEEGPLTRIVDIQFLGITLPIAELQSQLTLKKNEPLSLPQLDHSIDAIKIYYANHGYLDMVLENEKEGLVQYAKGGTEASLVFQVREGPLVKVASIVVDGLVRTHEKVVRLELEFQKGDVLTPQRMQDTQYRLQRTGLFSNIDIYTLEAGTPLAERTVIVHVSEVDPGVFNIGAGISTEFNLTLRGFAGIAYNNLGGTARAVSLRGEVKKVADLTFFDYRLIAGYLEPYLLDTRTKGRVNLTQEKTIIARLSSSIPAIDSTKLENVLEREFDRHFKLTYNVYGIQYIRNLNVLNDKEAEINREIIGYVGPTFEAEFRDNAFIPRSGTYSRLNVEYADPAFGSSNSIQYLRTVASFNFYVPFFDKKLVWANSVRGGLIQNLSTDRNRYVPISRKFFLGGQSTLRGYDPDAIPFGDTSDPLQSVQNPIVVRDDSTFYLLKTELHFPIAGDLEGEVFYDQGSVRISGYAFDPVQRESVGVGLRYITPVGPANLEYGYKLNHQPAEALGRFDISIGTF